MTMLLNNDSYVIVGSSNGVVMQALATEPQDADDDEDDFVVRLDTHDATGPPTGQGPPLQGGQPGGYGHPRAGAFIPRPPAGGPPRPPAGPGGHPPWSASTHH